MVQTSKGLGILSIFMSIVYLVVEIGISSIVCRGARFSSLGVAGRCHNSGIHSCGTPTGFNKDVTAGTVHALFKSR